MPGFGGETTAPAARAAVGLMMGAPASGVGPCPPFHICSCGVMYTCGGGGGPKSHADPFGIFARTSGSTLAAPVASPQPRAIAKTKLGKQKAKKTKMQLDATRFLYNAA